MPTTSPDGITSPSLGGPYNLIADMALLAEDVQDALIRRGNLYIGTSAERNLLQNPNEGVNWQDTDDGQHKYVYANSNWVRLGETAFSGTTAERASFVTAPQGALWQDTNGDNTLWRFEASDWVEVLPAFKTGAFTRITASGSNPSGGASGDIHFKYI